MEEAYKTLLVELLQRWEAVGEAELVPDSLNDPELWERVTVPDIFDDL